MNLSKYKKIGLVLSGGGAKGCIQLGALEYLIEYLECNPFNLIVGTSVGALNGSKIAENDLNGLKDIWFNIKSKKDIITKRTWGEVGLIFGADSVYSAKPLWKLIDKRANQSRILSRNCEFVSTVYDINNREAEYYSSKHESSVDYKKSIYASCLIPLVMEPVEFRGGKKLDGGVCEITPLQYAIDYGCDFIFVIRCSAEKLQPLEKMPSGIGILQSVVDVLVNGTYVNDVTFAYWINEWIKDYHKVAEYVANHPNVSADIKNSLDKLNGHLSGFRHIPIIEVIPEVNEMDTLDFEPEKIRNGYQLGRQLMERALEEYESNSNI